MGLVGEGIGAGVWVAGKLIGKAYDVLTSGKSNNSKPPKEQKPFNPQGFGGMGSGR